MLKNLRIHYTDNNGQKITKEYNTIMDFIDSIESNATNSPVIMGQHVEAEFFENPFHHKHFSTINDLYKHCKYMVQ